MADPQLDVTKIPVTAIDADNDSLLGVNAAGRLKRFASAWAAVRSVLSAFDGATKIGTTEGTVQAALDARPTSVELAAGDGSGIGATYEISSTSIALPPSKLQFFMRSSPIDVRTVLPGGYVTDASIDYSAYVQKLLDYFRDFGGGRMLLPPNLAILISNLIVYSGTEIVAPEWTSQLVAVTGGYGLSVNPGSGGTTNPDDNQRNILLSGFQLRTQVAVFDEQKHLINLNAISSSLIEDLLIKGYQGDGVYLGSGNVGGIERHNERITFRRNKFDGVNRDNRNGLSIIDGTDIVVDACGFYRSTRANMPSALDIEPNNNAFHRLRNISVENFYAEDCRGGYFFQVLNNLTTPASRISLRGFKMVNVDEPLAAAGSYATAPLTKVDPAQNIIIEQGSSKGGTIPIIIYGQQGLSVRDVSWEDFSGVAKIGDGSTARLRSFNVSMRNNNWLRCGTAAGSALKVDGITNFEYVNNNHIDCGDNTATGTAVEFSPSFTGALTLGLFQANNFDKSALANMVATRKTGAGALSFDYRNNAFNTYNGQSSIFIDDVDTAYTPVIYGSGTAGTAVYTKQIGRRVRVGNYMEVSFDITYSGHTGTGAALITMPFASVAAGPSVPVNILVDSIAYTAGKTVRAQIPAGQTYAQLLQEGPSAAIATINVPAAGTIRGTARFPLT